MSNSKLAQEIEQQERVVQDKTAAYEEAHATVGPLLNEIEKLDKSGKLTAKHKDKTSYATMRAKALNKQAEELLAEQNKLIELKNAAIRDQLEKQHGLLAFGLTTGKLGPEAALLHDTIGDYLTAQTDADRRAAERSAKLLWAHGCIIKGEKPPGSLSTPELDEFEALADPEDASAFYRKHEATIKAQADARKDAANQP